MTLRPSETRALFARECGFPADRASVVEAVGSVAVASQNGDDTDVATVLRRSETTRYASVGELHSTLMANLTDEHVGRRRYDDRSTTVRRETQLSL